MQRTTRILISWLTALAGATAACADPAPFDLVGPTLQVEVTRAGATLPAAQVPNLASGDRVWIKAQRSPEQTSHYLMVAVFLRGATDPPPAAWFFPCQTWSGKCADKGLVVSVPKEAQQLLVFLAPETGGDFKTLEQTVRARPGVFVRASQDLNQSELDRARLDSYLTAIRSLGDSDPSQLKEAAPLLSRSLAIKVDEKCLDKDPQMQVLCLSQGRESLILSDGHSASVTQELTSGAASDLAMEASSAPQLRSGYYGPYIGSLLDIARLFDSFHTAQYQYIPGLASAHGHDLALALNAAPSFQDPKSVLVMALPAVAHPQFPPLRPVAPKDAFCANKEPLVLPVEGAPLAFATAYAHDLALRLTALNGTTLELPARADPARGGMAIDTSALRSAELGNRVSATLHGQWGFDRYEGPAFQLVTARAQNWSLAPGEENALIVGREDTVHLHADNVACIAEISVDGGGRPLKTEWKALQPDAAEVKLPLHDALPGEVTLLIRRYGSAQPERLSMRAYAEAGHLDAFALHAGDRQGVLRGTRLDEVQDLVVNGVQFLPATLINTAGRDELSMQAAESPGGASLSPGGSLTARVSLQDGRSLNVPATVETARPSATLIGKSAQDVLAAGTTGIRLASQDELPQDARLTFALRAQSPASFSRDDRIEVASGDGSSAVLDVSNGAMTLQNAKVAVATLEPARALGASAFGPLRYRVVSSGVAGDWRPLATLVRLPHLTRLECPGGTAGACTLYGANLFLLQAVSADAQFTRPTAVPDGYTEQSLAVPRAADGQLYVKLRDDPSVVNLATVTFQPAVGGASVPLAAPLTAPMPDALPAPATVEPGAAAAHSPP
jgi:hypothetical protein